MCGARTVRWVTVLPVERKRRWSGSSGRRDCERQKDRDRKVIENSIANMPIRRNASPSAQETPVKNKPTADADVTSEESVSAEEEPENDTSAPEEEKKEAEKSGDEEKETKSSEEPKKEEKEPTKDKKIKKTIPSWATLSASQLARVQKNSQIGSTARPKMDAIVIEAIKACFQKSGASVVAIRKYIINKYPSLELERRGYILKQALKREMQRGAIKQVKGKGASGSFVVVTNAGKQTNKSKQDKKKTTSAGPMEQPIKLEDALPLAFTKLCEPKEASYSLIKKYLLQYYPKLNAESRPYLLKQALQRAVDKGQLEQITGKGASGTFQLKRAGDKPLLSGGPFEDAILSAITAMNEPKTCSTTALKKYVTEKVPATNSNFQMHMLKRTLQKCEKNGWIEQISGKGFSGSFQLCFPFYPSPSVLFPEKQHEEEEGESEEEEEDEDDDEEQSESEEEESDDEPPKKRHKAVPQAKAKLQKRKTATPKKIVAAKRSTPSRKVSAKKVAKKSRPAPMKLAKKPAAVKKSRRGSPKTSPATPKKVKGPVKTTRHSQRQRK
ncbi:heterochromatin protein 1-binding protein 3 [Scyliorhinus canicula]|uniref:heterochromatin protein 1-binding protein 3 n=1 Tax=Scyliorhinus canicula TaxID=7830 RepID=UPI0018F2FBBB|nr:heterochromatin protein 1-binding protein 3 [Scyliorhinus canicula]